MTDPQAQEMAEVPIPDAPMPPRLHDLDFTPVVLVESACGWKAGTEGVIVDAFVGKAIVEIADHRGRTLDTLTLPYSAINVPVAYRQERERELAY